jgi:hypothetical protein
MIATSGSKLTRFILKIILTVLSRGLGISCNKFKASVRAFTASTGLEF